MVFSTIPISKIIFGPTHFDAEVAESGMGEVGVGVGGRDSV